MRKKERTFIIQQIKQMTINSTIKPSESFVKKQMTIAIIFTCIGVIGLFIGVAHLLGLGILFFVITTVQKKRDIIKIFENHLEIKFAPLASTKFIKYSDLIQVERASEKKIIIHYNKGATPKKFRVPIHMIEAKELESFLNMIDNKINKAE